VNLKVKYKLRAESLYAQFRKEWKRGQGYKLSLHYFKQSIP